MRLVALPLVLGVLGACSDSRIADTSDGAPTENTSSCSPDCNSDQLCFAAGPPDAAPPASCQFVPTACASNPSCACLGSALCTEGYDYCNYDELAGYVVLQCSE